MNYSRIRRVWKRVLRTDWGLFLVDTVGMTVAALIIAGCILGPLWFVLEIIERVVG